MNTIKIVAISIALLFVQACSHPIEIEGQGDVTSASGNRNCSLEQFQAGDDVCSKNSVAGAYQETYYAVPRAGWTFDHWGNYCPDATPPNYDCHFNISAEVVRRYWGQTVPPLKAVFTSLSSSNGVFGDSWDGVAKSFADAIMPNFNGGGQFLTMAGGSAAEHRNFYITHYDNNEVSVDAKIRAVHNAGGKIVFYTNPSEITGDNDCGPAGTSNPISIQEALNNEWASCSNITSYGAAEADVNNAAYRALFIQRTMTTLDSLGFDGVFMDNLWAKPQFQAGNLALIKACVAAAHQRGKICGGNITTFEPGEEGDFVNWTNSIAGVLDYGMHEFFGSWGGGVTTSRLLTQLSVTEKLTSSGSGVLMYTNLWKNRPASEALLIFGASMLVANKNTKYQMDVIDWGGDNTGNYTSQWRFAEMDKNYGQPLENRVTLATNTFRRKFQNGTVYVNLDGAGHTVDGVYVAPTTAVFK